MGYRIRSRPQHLRALSVWLLAWLLMATACAALNANTATSDPRTVSESRETLVFLRDLAPIITVDISGFFSQACDDFANDKSNPDLDGALTCQDELVDGLVLRVEEALEKLGEIVRCKDGTSFCESRFFNETLATRAGKIINALDGVLESLRHARFGQLRSRLGSPAVRGIARPRSLCEAAEDLRATYTTRRNRYEDLVGRVKTARADALTCRSETSASLLADLAEIEAHLKQGEPLAWEQHVSWLTSVQRNIDSEATLCTTREEHRRDEKKKAEEAYRAGVAAGRGVKKKARKEEDAPTCLPPCPMPAEKPMAPDAPADAHEKVAPAGCPRPDSDVWPPQDAQCIAEDLHGAAHVR